MRSDSAAAAIAGAGRSGVEDVRSRADCAATSRSRWTSRRSRRPNRATSTACRRPPGPGRRRARSARRPRRPWDRARRSRALRRRQHRVDRLAEIGELGNGARSPSIEKTVSVTTNRRRAGVDASSSLEVQNVVVPVHRDVRLRQPAPVDDARVVQFVGEDDVTFARERVQRADVRQVSGREQHGVLGRLECGERMLRGRDARVVGPRDQPRRA